MEKFCGELIMCIITYIILRLLVLSVFGVVQQSTLVFRVK